MTWEAGPGLGALRGLSHRVCPGNTFSAAIFYNSVSLLTIFLTCFGKRPVGKSALLGRHVTSLACLTISQRMVPVFVQERLFSFGTLQILFVCLSPLVNKTWHTSGPDLRGHLHLEERPKRQQCSFGKHPILEICCA